MKIVIYGANEMASAIAADLFEDHDVIVIDPCQKKLDGFSRLDIGIVCADALNINTLKDQYSSVAIITKDNNEAEKIYSLIKDIVSVSYIQLDTKEFRRDLVVVPAYLAKGLEFDSVILYNDRENSYKTNERNLLYVACTRAQHELYIYN